MLPPARTTQHDPLNQFARLGKTTSKLFKKRFNIKLSLRHTLCSFHVAYLYGIGPNLYLQLHEGWVPDGRPEREAVSKLSVYCTDIRHRSTLSEGNTLSLT